MASEIILVSRPRKYHWPEAQLNIWLIIMLAAAATDLGIFAYFMTVQSQLGLGTPWLFPYEVTVSSLALLFVLLINVLIARRLLVPGIVVLGALILWVLWLTGLIETAIQLFGPVGSVSGNCNVFITGTPVTGESLNTLAWLEQSNICSCWQAAFAFEVIGTLFLLWVAVMAWRVNRDEYD